MKPTSFRFHFLLDATSGLVQFTPLQTAITTVSYYSSSRGSAACESILCHFDRKNIQIFHRYDTGQEARKELGIS